jgi:hypothetical protein
MVETYKGVPVVERPSRLWLGQYANGTIYVRPDLTPKERVGVLQHEYKHHLFFTKHPWVGNHRANTLLMWFIPVVAYYGPPYVYTLLLLPVLIETAHEADVNIQLNDVGPRAIIKASVCVVGMACAVVVGMIIQRASGVV